MKPFKDVGEAILMLILAAMVLAGVLTSTLVLFVLILIAMGWLS